MRTTYAKLYEENYAHLYKTAYKILNDRYYSEDAVEQVFCNIIKSKKDFSNMDNVERRKYLTVAVKHTAGRMRSNMEKDIEFCSDKVIDDCAYENDYMCPQKVSEEYEKMRCLKEAISKLTSGNREIMYMYLIDDLSTKEIAEKMNMNREAVKKRIQRTKLKLANLYKGVLE